ncbi:MAG TPA: alcohol dehydrogenase catalytic domain-containing protein [Ktedonobacterales bacterium]
MKAVIYHRYDDVRIEEVPIPAIGPDELLLRPAGCGLCGSDIAKIVGRAAPPVILGHELAGHVAEAGAAVTAFRPGDRVVVAHHVPCGACHYCLHGHPSMCARFKASNIFPAGFAEYVRVPAENVRQTTLPLPDHLSDEEASFTEPLACCLRAVRRSALLPGDTALVVGLGSIGLQMAQAVKALVEGARVIGIDLLEERLALGRALGVDLALHGAAGDLAEQVRAWTDGRGVDVAILTAGGARAVQQALGMLRAGGMLNLFACPPGLTASVDLSEVYHHELTLAASYSSSPADLRQALELLAAGKVRVADLISHRLPLEQFHEGFELARTQQALKVFFVNEI